MSKKGQDEVDEVQEGEKKEVKPKRAASKKDLDEEIESEDSPKGSEGLRKRNVKKGEEEKEKEEEKKEERGKERGKEEGKGGKEGRGEGEEEGKKREGEEEG